MSFLVTGGDSSEKLAKPFRRSLSTEAKIEEFSSFKIPDISHLQCYLRKYPNFQEENIPFCQFQPSQRELEENNLIERKRKEEKGKKLRGRARSIVFEGEPGSLAL